MTDVDEEIIEFLKKLENQTGSKKKKQHKSAKKLDEPVTPEVDIEPPIEDIAHFPPVGTYPMSYDDLDDNDKAELIKEMVPLIKAKHPITTVLNDIMNHWHINIKGLNELYAFFSKTIWVTDTASKLPDFNIFINKAKAESIVDHMEDESPPEPVSDGPFFTPGSIVVPCPGYGPFLDQLRLVFESLVEATDSPVPDYIRIYLAPDGSWKFLVPQTIPTTPVNTPEPINTDSKLLELMELMYSHVMDEMAKQKELYDKIKSSYNLEKGD